MDQNEAIFEREIQRLEQENGYPYNVQPYGNIQGYGPGQGYTTGQVGQFGQGYGRSHPAYPQQPHPLNNNESLKRALRNEIAAL